MKIYTRTGDGGETDLFGGPRVSKDAARIEACGAVDELNAQLGWAATMLPECEGEIRGVQSDLFALGAGLATREDAAPAAAARTGRVAAAQTSRLEAWIDRCDAETEPLARFILPGGAAAAAALHVARAVCRRAERRVVTLAASEPVDPELLAYLNRLSDLLFVLARWANARRGVEEPVWRGGHESP